MIGSGPLLVSTLVSSPFSNDISSEPAGASEEHSLFIMSGSYDQDGHHAHIC